MSYEQLPCPAELGYRMPAEWEPQEGVWLSWPHRIATWPGKFGPIPAFFAELASEISEGQFVHINVLDQAMEDSVTELLKAANAHLERVRFHHIATNDTWVRDHGPIYVVKDEAGRRGRALTNWGYNAWGNKYHPHDADAAVPLRIAEEFKEPVFSNPMILEGGSIDVNGAGLLLTTEACLLNKNRNPHLSKEEIEEQLKRMLAVKKILWIGDGIVGDDTDGHVDDITRFVNINTIVTAVEEDPQDVNYKALHENYLKLQAMTDLNGKPLNIIPIPMPNAVVHAGNRLPASYANFLITNTKVLVPIYNCNRDQIALDILAKLFPTRKVVGLQSTDLVWGLGSIHCVTQQQPAVG
ncbi:agmatine deiminase family protein [Planctomicrobium sp. SH668]|uniref:agmatine deiminase family protein n=1 Tax=Planctomicrobium sp. SH668 TaxID=3448126 RepID=UPI003F5B111D